MQNVYQKLVTAYGVFVAAHWNTKEKMPTSGSPLTFNDNGKLSTFEDILPHCEFIINTESDKSQYVWNPKFSKGWCGGFNTVTIKVPMKPELLEQQALAISVYSALFPTFLGLVAENKPYTDIDDMGWLALGEYTGSIITMAWAAQDLPEKQSVHMPEEERLLRYFWQVYSSKEPGSGKTLIEKFLQKDLPWDVDLIFEEILISNFITIMTYHN